MSIESVPRVSNSVIPKTGVHPGAPSVPFSEYLKSQNELPEQVSAETAAEILRLKMMNSAMDIGDQTHQSVSNPTLPIEVLLNTFIEQQRLHANLPTTLPYGAPESPVSHQDVSDPGETSVRTNTNFDGIIARAAQRYGVDKELIRAVIKTESEFNPNAVSHAGAQGLMQLMPATAKGLGVTDAFDPEQNVMAGTRFLKDLLQRYGNVDEALAAYNWGPGNVDRHGCNRLPRETQQYLTKVKGLYAAYQA